MIACWKKDNSGADDAGIMAYNPPSTEVKKITDHRKSAKTILAYYYCSAVGAQSGAVSTRTNFEAADFPSFLQKLRPISR